MKQCGARFNGKQGVYTHVMDGAICTRLYALLAEAISLEFMHLCILLDYKCPKTRAETYENSDTSLRSCIKLCQVYAKTMRL